MIFVDATVVDALSVKAFRAVLDNGHRLVAFVGDGGAPPPAAGGRVRLRMSPYDMSRGERVAGEGMKSS
jgi:translation initiation factor IF-1